MVGVLAWPVASFPLVEPVCFYFFPPQPFYYPGTTFSGALNDLGGLEPIGSVSTKSVSPECREPD